MRFLFCLMVFAVVANTLHSQIISGRIVHEGNAVPLPGVVIENLNSKSFHAISDEEGHYAITAATGDSIRFSLLGFYPRTVLYNGENSGWFSWIAMTPRSYIIDTVIVKKELTQYQKDSLENRGIYGKQVDYRPAKPQLPKLKDLEAGKPLVIKAPISGFIEKRQKKYKRLKAFQERYVATETQRFIDSRYTPGLVTELTGLSGDSLLRFMQAYPMPYSFARAASELEVRMWVRYYYKEWMKHDTHGKP